MNDLKILFEEKFKQYNQPEFIEQDPISVPHRFSGQQDIEIMAFFAAILAWGQRKTIIKNALKIAELMDNAPYQFLKNHKENDLKRFIGFSHRTFNDTDLLYFISFLKFHYASFDTLETAFTQHYNTSMLNIEPVLIGFEKYFFSLTYFPQRTKKHISSPARKSACKRLCMFLRWMVRNDENGIDFGIWKTIQPAQLICPIDTHVLKIAEKYKLIPNKISGWKAALLLTDFLKTLDINDPVKYDFALFGMGKFET